MSLSHLPPFCHKILPLSYFCQEALGMLFHVIPYSVPSRERLKETAGTELARRSLGHFHSQLSFASADHHLNYPVSSLPAKSNSSVDEHGIMTAWGKWTEYQRDTARKNGRVCMCVSCVYVVCESLNQSRTNLNQVMFSSTTNYQHIQRKK